jgi:glycosyltransferase involved in cell wall biosynthesis
VDNASTDETAQTAIDLCRRYGQIVHYVYEPQGGKSQALNTGIALTSGDLVGMIDDDEEVDRGWYRRIAEAFADPTIDYVGGPYIPRWTASPPSWLPNEYLGALGWAENGASPAIYGDEFHGMLKGGNAVIRRDVLKRIGPYSTALGPTPRFRFMSCEDEDMYLRLLSSGARGVYFPDLVVYHHIGSERLTRSYFRKWCFWRGASQGLRARHKGAPAPRVAGIPRWIVGAAARGAAAMMRSLIPWVRTTPRFADELAVWDLAGFVYGRHFLRARG